MLAVPARSSETRTVGWLHGMVTKCGLLTLIERSVWNALRFREKQMSDVARCQLCGEPMPPGEEMFKYHGYSGDCPKPPLRQVMPVAEISARDEGGVFWIDVKVDKKPYHSAGPFNSAGERDRARADLLAMLEQI